MLPLGYVVLPDEVPVPESVVGVVELALVVPVPAVVPVLLDELICCLNKSFLYLKTVPYFVMDAVSKSLEEEDG